ncbi:MAG: hypothetical protein ACYTGV_13125 [Planctomycetota bacterium]|jgi:hypothetical protein
MPNTIGHFGVQGIATRILIKEADPKWIFAGCIIPDVPWILRRAVFTLVPSSNAYDLRLYAIAQSTLVLCLVLAGALALLSRRPKLTFLVLGLNSLFHLILDACQIKWGSGIYLFVPGSWMSTDLGTFWPESWPTYLLTLLGLIYVSLACWRRMGDPVSLRIPRGRSLLAAVALLVAYFLLPLALMGGAEAANAHFVHTVREPRAGAKVEFDRNQYSQSVEREVLKSWARTEIQVEGSTPRESAQISLKGTYKDPKTIVIHEYHVHEGFNRDLMSFAGLALFLLVWLRSFRDRR